MFSRFLTAAVLSCALGISWAGSALAGELVFTVDNEFSEDVAIEFYSTDRNHIWPGGDQVWIVGVSDGEISYPLTCNSGEQICFGAWSINQQDQWGLGMDMSQDCAGCCAQCGDIIEDVIILD